MKNNEILAKEWCGKTVEQLPTPVIIADVEAIEKNLTLLSNYFQDKHYIIDIYSINYE